MNDNTMLNSAIFSGLFALCGVLMILLCVQNYRYGLYPLVYSSILIATILMSLGYFERASHDRKLRNIVNHWLLGLSLMLVLMQSFWFPEELKYWALALSMLSFVTMQLSVAMPLNTIMMVGYCMSLWGHSGAIAAISFTSCYALLISFGSAYAKLQLQRDRILVELEIKDPLTGAYNYRHLEDTLEKELSRADRTGKALSIMAIEIDYFPQIEEIHGPHTRDQLLANVSKHLGAMIRAGDSQYFHTPSTYYILLPCTPPEGLVVISERIRRSIEESQWPIVDDITVSLGCSSYIPGKRPITVNGFISGANIGLVEAQKNGHNRVCHH